MTELLHFDKQSLLQLPAEQLTGRLMALPVRERLELLLDRLDAAAVVRAFPPQDFYVFVKEVGDEDVKPLLALATMEQINHLLDLDGWRQDQIQAGKALLWLEKILMASDQKFLEWLYTADFELLVLLCKQWLEIRILPEDFELADMDDDFPRTTIDDQFYFEIKYPQHEELLKSMLSFLFETHNSFYRELLTHVMHDLNSDVEELAYQFHKGRLEDNAIPDILEAATIYRPLKAGEIGRRAPDKASNDELRAVPIFAMMLISRSDLLTEALVRIDDQGVRRTLQMEFASLANKIIVADALESDDPNNLRRAADKAAAYVNLSLDAECHGEPAQAADLLRTMFVEDLFRLAQARILAVTRQMKALLSSGWLSRWPHGLNCLESEWQESASLLVQVTPLIHRDKTDSQSERDDFIRTIADLEGIRRLVETIANLDAVFTDLEGAVAGNWQALAATLWRKGQLNSLESVTLGSLVLTAAASELWEKSWNPSPLPVVTWPEILPCLAPESMEEVIDRRLATILPDDGRRKLAASYLASIIRKYRDEMTGLEGGAMPEAWLTPFFLFTGQENDKKIN